MRRVFAGLLWAVVLLLLLAGIDQLLVRITVQSPVPLAVVTFYRDLRSRMQDLAKGLATTPASPARPMPPGRDKLAPPASIDQLIEQHQSRPAIPLPSPSAGPAEPKLVPQGKDQAPRFIYADDGGELHFAATLAEIPERYRDRARPLGQ